MAMHIVIGSQKFMWKSGGCFVYLQSARGLAQSKTLRVAGSCAKVRQVLDCARPSAAFPGHIIVSVLTENSSEKLAAP